MINRLKPIRDTVKRFFKPFKPVWKSIFFLGIAAGIFGGFISSAVKKPHPEIYPYQFPAESHWIAPTGDAQSWGVFRTSFQLPPKKIARGWMIIAADNGFEVNVNSNPVGRWSLYRATRPFQGGHSEYGQRLRFQPTAIGLNFPREYQWDDHKNYQLPMLLDITRYLRESAKNTLAITAESRHPTPAFILYGEVIFKDGTKIKIHSNTAWKGSYVPYGSNAREWTEPHFPDDSWPLARRIRPPIGNQWVVPPRGVYEEPFSNKWRLAPASGKAVFQTTWNIKDDFDAGWIRVFTTGPYIMKINGKAIRPRTGAGYHVSQGLWVAQPSNRRWLAVNLERMDTSEAGGTHVGSGFLTPAHGDRSVDQFKTSESKMNLGKDSTSDPTRNDLLRRQYEDKARRPNMANPINESLSGRLPTVLTRRFASPDLCGFDITAYLKKGANEIEISLVGFPKPYKMPSSRRIAVDGGLLNKDQLTQHLTDSHGWTCNGDASLPTMKPQSNNVAQKFYRIGQPEGFPHHYSFAAATVLGWSFFLLSFLTGFLNAYQVRKSVGPIFGAAFVIVMMLWLRTTLAERSDYMWFVTNSIWQYLTLAFAVTVGLTIRKFKYGKERTLCPPGNPRSKSIYHILLLIVLFIGLIVRYTGVEDQPLDDDEYASVQTTLNIAISGLPEIYKGIWYTRGPVYHYIAGTLIYFFGPNLWVMRFLAIMGGLGAALLTYLISSRVVKSRAIGIAGALIICLNPFCIFTSHVARFYQQQQTMTIATIYFFIMGFIQKSVPWQRAMAFICFGIAVLSQEISLLLIVPCGICYALMARPEGTRNELRFLFICAAVMGLIVLNLLTFKVKCLTRLEGISPNIESTMSPHFSYPMNFLSLFIGYSRLHVFLAPFSIIGMVVCLKKRATGMLAVTFFLLVGIFSTVLLVTGLGFRYQYSYLPLWVIASLFGVRAVAEKICRDWGGSCHRFMGCVIIFFAIMSFSPWKIPGSYSIRILPDSSGAASFVRANMRPDDRVAITEPHPHCALLEAGRADYDICLPILYDFVYRSEEDGRLVDRNGGAESMGRIGTLQRAMAQHDRIWILMNREKIKNVSRNFRWEYAGARFDYFVRQNCQFMYHTYAWDVYLWDRQRGVNQSFRMEPEAWAE